MYKNLRFLCFCALFALFAESMRAPLLMSMYNKFKMARERREGQTKVPILCHGTCETRDGIEGFDRNYLSQSDVLYICVDSMRIDLFEKSEKGADGLNINQFITIKGNYLLRNDNNLLVFREYDSNNLNRYVQVSANSKGEILVSLYSNGKYSNTLFYQIDLEDSEYNRRYNCFLSNELVSYEDRFNKKNETKSNYYDAMKQQLDDNNSLSDIERQQIETRLRKIESEEKNYDQLISKEAQESAPKFGLK